jgi:hypothetical protein
MDIVEERAEHYGAIRKGQGNIHRIAGLWSAYLGTSISEHDVAWMMVLLKASRSKQDPHHLDDYTDAQGYLDIAEQLR